VIGVMSELASTTFSIPGGLVFQPEEVIFRSTSRSEIRDILSRRVQIGFYPVSWRMICLRLW